MRAEDDVNIVCCSYATRFLVASEMNGRDTKGIYPLKPFLRFALLGYDYVIATPDAEAGVPLHEEATSEQ